MTAPIDTQRIKDFTAGGKVWVLKEPIEIEYREDELDLDILMDETEPIFVGIPAGVKKEVYDYFHSDEVYCSFSTWGFNKEDVTKALRTGLSIAFEDIALTDTEYRFDYKIFNTEEDETETRGQFERLKKELWGMVKNDNQK